LQRRAATRATAGRARRWQAASRATDHFDRIWGHLCNRSRPNQDLSMACCCSVLALVVFLVALAEWYCWWC
jgi:hypothetical protein